MPRKFTDVDYGNLQALLTLSMSIKAIALKLHFSERCIRKWRRSKVPPSGNKRKHSREFQQKVERRRKAVKRTVDVKIVRKAKRYTPVRRIEHIRKVVLHPYANPGKASRYLRGRGIQISLSTARRDLKAIDYRPWSSRRGPYLEEKHKEQRVTFCRYVLTMRLKVLFSDEKQIDSNQRRKIVVWGPKWQRFYGHRTVEQEAPSLWLWGIIGEGFKHLMITAPQSITKEVYQKQFLTPVIPLLKKQTRRGAVFMQDNAPPHKGALEFLKRHGVKVLQTPWPSKSPDLNPIEQVWGWLEAEVKTRGPYGVDELRCFVQEAWDNLKQERIDALVRGFVVRCQDAIETHGDVVKPRNSGKSGPPR